MRLQKAIETVRSEKPSSTEFTEALELLTDHAEKGLSGGYLKKADVEAMLSKKREILLEAARDRRYQKVIRDAYRGGAEAIQIALEAIAELPTYPQTDQTEAEGWKQRLFNFMSQEHDVALMDSDMNEILLIINPPVYPVKVHPVKEGNDD